MKSVMNVLFLASLLVMLCIGCGNASLSMEASEPIAVERFGEVIVPSAMEPAEENTASEVEESVRIAPPVEETIEAAVTETDAMGESNRVTSAESQSLTCDDGICLMREENGVSLWFITKVSLETFLCSYETRYPEWTSGVMNGKYYHIAEGNGYMYILEDCGKGMDEESQEIIEAFISENGLIANPICISPHYTAPGAEEELVRRQQVSAEVMWKDAVKERVYSAVDHAGVDSNVKDAFVEYIMVDPEFLDHYGGEKWSWSIEIGDMRSFLLCCMAPGEDVGMQHINFLIYNSGNVFQGPSGYVEDAYMDNWEIANFISQPDYIAAETEVPNGVEIETETADAVDSGEN